MKDKPKREPKKRPISDSERTAKANLRLETQRAAERSKERRELEGLMIKELAVQFPFDCLVKAQPYRDSMLGTHDEVIGRVYDWKIRHSNKDKSDKVERSDYKLELHLIVISTRSMSYVVHCLPETAEVMTNNCANCEQPIIAGDHYLCEACRA